MPASEAIRLYRGASVLPMSLPPIENGGVAVRGGEILGVGTWKELVREYPSASKEDLGEVILMPGLINAHCHLDYTMMRGALFGEGSFSEWIQRLNAMRRSLDKRDYLDAIAAGMKELQQWGCTTVLNIESFPELVPFLLEPPIRVWWFLEVMDVRSRLQSAEALAGAIYFLEKAGEGLGGFGISPHAPYTVSRELYELSSTYALNYQLPLCTHLAESEEEMSMFTKGEGLLYEFLCSIGRPMEDCKGMTPIQAVLGRELVPEGSILVHMNQLDSNDRELLKRTAGRYPVVHCPRTHEFFKRPPFDLNFFRESGIPLLLGTDSLASNQDLNMFAEMRALSESFPMLDPGEILRMVTIAPAAAIGRAGRLGQFSPGALADFIAIPDLAPNGGLKGVAERVLANRTPPTVCISGQS